MTENRFTLVAPMRNASDTLGQMLMSVCGQSYKNWRLILIDDFSDEDHWQREGEIISEFRSMLDERYRDRIEIVWNDTRKWEVANVLHGISMCGDDDIVCRIDGDDYLCDLDALRIINEVYKQTWADCLWTNHRWFDDERVTSNNISAPMPDHVDPYVYPWVSSHFKTFRKRLLNGVNDENFRGRDGEYFKRIGDQTIMLPVLQNAKKRFHLPLCTYAYRCDMSPSTFQTDDAKFQRDEAIFLRERGFVP